MKTVTLSQPAQMRHFFETDSKWDEAHSWLIDALDTAAERAAASSKRYVLDPSKRERALWDEAVAQTLERILGSVVLGEPSDDIELPKWPES